MREVFAIVICCFEFSIVSRLKRTTVLVNTKDNSEQLVQLSTYGPVDTLLVNAMVRTYFKHNLFTIMRPSL